jgi:hypothetical protein
LRRLRQSHRWVVLQFAGTALLILVGILWTRLPEKHIWQVALSLLLPLLLAASALALQAGTVRALADDDGKRVHLVWVAVSLMFWIVVVWIAWVLLDSCDGRIASWASYLNSQAPAHLRARLLTFEHIYNGLRRLEWILRWIVVPAKVIPYVAASAQWGYKLPWRRVLRLLWNWQWWLAVVLISLLAVWLPGWLFTGNPHGAVSAQVWRIGLKLFASYLLGIAGWLLLLGWGSALFSAQGSLPENDSLSELFQRLRKCIPWVAAQYGWVLMWIWVNVAVLHFPGIQRWPAWLSESFGVSWRIIISIMALLVQAVMLRSLIVNHVRSVRLAWGTLALLLWGVLGLIVSSMETYLHGKSLPWLLTWLVAPAVFMPFAAASATWGMRLPWRRVLRVVCAWRWMLGVLLAAVVGTLAEDYIDAVSSVYVWDVDLATGLKMGAADILETSVWILLLGWLAVLFARTAPPANKTLVEVPALVGPPESGQESSVKLPLPEDN